MKMGTSLWFPSSIAGGARLLGGFHGAYHVCLFRVHNFVPVPERIRGGTRQEGRVRQGQRGGRGGGGAGGLNQAYVQVCACANAQSVWRSVANVTAAAKSVGGLSSPSLDCRYASPTGIFLCAKAFQSIAAK